MHLNDDIIEIEMLDEICSATFFAVDLSVDLPDSFVCSYLFKQRFRLCRVDYRNLHLQKWYQSEILLVITKKFSE